MKTKKYMAPAIEIEETLPILLETPSIRNIEGNSGLPKGSGSAPNEADSRFWDWDDDYDDF
jgi:hypothetical protein